MAKQLQLRRGLTSEVTTFTGAEGELIYDVEKKTLSVHDGKTKGGNPVSIPTQNATTTKAGVVTLSSNIQGGSATKVLTEAQGKTLEAQSKSLETTKQNKLVFAKIAGTTVKKGYGISSVTKLATGHYEVTMTNNAKSTEYAVLLSSTGVNARFGAASINLDLTFNQTLNKFRFVCNYGGDNTVGSYDPTVVNILVLE